MLDVALLGTGGMMPLPGRFLTSLLCRVNGKHILIDCGEGSQVTLKMLGWGFKSIDIICFTHFHADHISGLPGLLLTIGNSGRTEPLRMYGPPGLSAVVKCLCIIAPELPFPIEMCEWNPKADNAAMLDDLTLRALPLDHRTPCFAYSLMLPRRGKFDPERARKDQVPMEIWSALQKQNDAEIVYNGRRYTSDMVLGPPRRGLKVAYCTDTRPTAALPGFVRDADLLVCEGLYGENDKQEKAALHRHMIFSEAAEIARQGGVKELWLTHFSPAMPDPETYLDQAAALFPNTRVGCDRMRKTLRFEDYDNLRWCLDDGYGIDSGMSGG